MTLNYHFNIFDMPIYLNTVMFILKIVPPNLKVGHPQVLKSETIVYQPHLFFRQILFLV
jgi:hypothetical protein